MKSPVRVGAFGGNGLLVLIVAKFFSAAAQRPTPVSKVVEILENLQQKIRGEGVSESASYSEFSCWCKATTLEISKLIKEGEAQIELLSATLEGKNADLQARIARIEKLYAQKNEDEIALEKEQNRCKAEKEAYTQEAAELKKGMNGMDAALDALDEASRPGVSLLEVGNAFRSSLQGVDLETFALAVNSSEALAFLQAGYDPNDPNYKFKSDGIRRVIQKLRNDVNDRRVVVLNKWSQDVHPMCRAMEEQLQLEISSAVESLTSEKQNRDNLKADIAQLNIDLTSEQGTFQDDQQYLKGITENCEARARDWDQRAQTRHEEEEALKKVHDIMIQKVAPSDTVNERALLQSPEVPAKAAPISKGNSTGIKSSADEQSEEEEEDDNAADTPDVAAAVAAAATPPPQAAFMQRSPAEKAEGEATIKNALAGLKSLNAHAHSAPQMPTSFLQEAVATSALARAATKQKVQEHSQQGQKMKSEHIMTMLEEQRQHQMDALRIVQQEGRRLQSASLVTLAMHLQADPFGKVKALIRSLIDRLLTEQRQESDKRAFCQSQMGQKRKLAQERKYRWEESLKLASEIKTLQAREGTLEASIVSLTGEISTLEQMIFETTDQRRRDKLENLAAINMGKEGLEGVKECLEILKAVYARAARAAARHEAGENAYGGSFLQLHEEPDTNADRIGVYSTPPPVAEGSYNAAQDNAHGIMALMETIQSDFERTIKNTEAEEAKAATKFAKLNMDSNGILSNKRKKQEMEQGYLTTTSEDLGKSEEDFKKTIKLVDDLNTVLAELEPVCARTSQTYDERVAARQEEIAALTRATCALDPNDVEPDCTSGVWPLATTR